MADNDHFSQFKIPSLFQKNPVFHSFITQEISKKVELVAHLVENSSKDIVILGPEGVGKSTLISILLKQKKDSWFNCIIPATIHLTYEAIENKIKLSKNKSIFDKRVKHDVLIIDDAINLQSGLINTVLDNIRDVLDLKIIFLCTHEEYEQKTISDPLLKNCYLIEVAPLTKNQCAEFLQFLAPHKDPTSIEYEDNKITEIFLETQGLPGKIVQLLPETLIFKQKNNALLILVIAVFVLIIIALTTQYLTMPNSKLELRSINSILDSPAQF